MTSIDKLTGPQVLTPYEKKLQERAGVGTEDEKLYKNLGIGHKEQELKKNNADGVGDFMTLFLAQLKNQNPLDPQDGAEFVSQLAQFNSVESLHKIDDSVNKMSDAFRSSRILEATGMIGKSIDVETGKMAFEASMDDDGFVTANTIKGSVVLPEVKILDPNNKDLKSISKVEVSIIDPKTNEVIDQFPMGPQVSGATVNFSWNGIDKNGDIIANSSGNPIPNGEYLVKAQALIGDKWETAKTVIPTKVDSVTISSETGDVILHAREIGSVKLSELKTIKE